MCTDLTAGVSGESISQLWLFWVAPIIGAALGGAIYAWLGHERPDIVGE